MRRVVITGMGLVSPLGRGLSFNWDGLISAVSPIRRITRFDATEVTSQIAGEVPFITDDYPVAGALNPDEIISAKERRRIDDFILYGITAGKDALQDAGLLDNQNEEDKERTGVIIGSGIGGLTTIHAGAFTVKEQGQRRLSPFFIPASIINMASGYLSIMYQLRGPNSAPAVACATASHAISDSARLIMLGDADVMLAGGAEAAVNPLAFAGFCQARSLSTSFNNEPYKASRPWDKDRDGFVLSEGAGVLVLEELEHAKKRGARIYAELTGYGLTGDGYHITSPDTEGHGAARAMKLAIQKAKINNEDIGYINAHSTSTVVGDLAELNAIKSVFSNCLSEISVSSTKSVTGHLLGAAGSVEAIYSILALNNGILPPTANLINPVEEADGIDLVPLTAKEKPVSHVLSNSFGFGGTNASLVFSAFTE